jgi:hypothetical protein
MRLVFVNEYMRNDLDTIEGTRWIALYIDGRIKFATYQEQFQKVAAQNGQFGYIIPKLATSLRMCK